MTSLETYGSATWEQAAGPARPLGLGQALRRAAWSVGKIAFLVALTGVVLGSASLLARRSGPEMHRSAPSFAWVDINRPIFFYGLAGTEFGRLRLNYSARRNVSGGGREDVLTFGSTGGDQPYLKLSLYRIGTEPIAAVPFGAELDRLARESRARLLQAGAPATLATAFGPFETADMRLVSGALGAPCLGFRNAEAGGGILRISGLICGTSERPIGRDTLGCVIDRIDLDAGGGDTALQDLFVAAERRRNPGCAPSRLTAAGARTTWLDANGSVPPLKGPLGQNASAR